MPKMWDKILKIKYFTIRHLQNLKTLSAEVLSKYELHTPLPRCDWLMQHIKVCVGELTTSLGNGGRPVEEERHLFAALGEIRL